MPIRLMQRYSREDLKANPDQLFVFGDNCAREGLGGQAYSARGEPNAVGICTKKSPEYGEDDFFTDREYTQNIFIILSDFVPVFEHLKMNKVVVWPIDGIGTGISDLPNRAPYTLRFIETVKGALVNIYGLTEFI